MAINGGECISKRCHELLYSLDRSFLVCADTSGSEPSWLNPGLGRCLSVLLWWSLWVLVVDCLSAPFCCLLFLSKVIVESRVHRFLSAWPPPFTFPCCRVLICLLSPCKSNDCLCCDAEHVLSFLEFFLIVWRPCHYLLVTITIFAGMIFSFTQVRLSVFLSYPSPFLMFPW